jgi:hypothetical protein
VNLGDTYPWNLLAAFGHLGLGTALIETIEWLTLVATVWMLIELLLPLETRPRWDIPTLARGWAVLVLLLSFVGTPVALQRYHFYRFIHSPASTDFRTFGPGTIGESLCKRKDVKSAQERADRLGAALKDDELRWLLLVCPPELTSATPKDDIEVNAKLIGVMARLIATHPSTTTPAGYCGLGQEFLGGLYSSFVPQYLVSAKENGLHMDCLMGPPSAGKQGAPLWWMALNRTNADPGFWRDRIDTLKHLGVDIRQKSLRTIGPRSTAVIHVWGKPPPRVQQLLNKEIEDTKSKVVPGGDALSGIDVRGSPTSPLIEALVDEGLDVSSPSEIDGIALSTRMMYWRHGTRTDDPEVLRLSEKLGDLPPAKIQRMLLSMPTETHRWNDDQQTLFWTWVATQVGPSETARVVLGETASTDERQFPKLNALARKLLEEKMNGT